MKIAFFIILVFFLVSCGKPRPMTFEEQQVYMAKQQCWQEATDMNPDWPSPWNPAWNSYFYMCMSSLGISPEAIDRIWE